MDVTTNYTVRLPISCNTLLVAIPIDTNLENTPIIFGTDSYTKTSFNIGGRRVSGVTNLWFRYVAFCL